jgi:hypothetical protein
MEIFFDALVQGRAAADEIAYATAESGVDGTKDELAEIERRMIAYPTVRFDQIIRRVAHPFAALVETALDATVQQFPQSGHAYHPCHIAVFDRARKFFARQFGQVGDLRAARERGQKAGGEFERVMQREDGEHAVLRRHVEDGGEHRDHAREILVREHDGFRLAGRARSEDERGRRLRVNLRRQKRKPLVFDLLRRQREYLFKTPDARRL